MKDFIPLKMNSVLRMQIKLLLILILIFGIFSGFKKKKNILTLIKQHYQVIISDGTDHYGPESSPVWMSSLDPATKEYPVNDSRPAHIPARVYLDRSVDAPKGATLYWNFPDVAAAFEISDIINDPSLKNAAKEYVRYVFSNCKANNGVLLWGNHYYYDAFQDQCVRFNSKETPVPVDIDYETGDLHEMRPFSPPWEILWQINAATTKKHILTAVNNHIVDQKTGEFNRHADQKSGYAFLEYGGILSYSLVWLYQKTKDESLLEKANAIINFSYGFRNPKTGLMENSPTQDRWDKYASTTEVGLWGNYILKAVLMAPEKYRDEWISKVENIIGSWIVLGYDEENQQYFGGLNVADGSPYHPDPDYPYQPGYHANIWNPLFPTHNYPLQLAESCLQLYKITGKEIYEQAVKRWIIHIKKQTDQRKEDQLLYAENYGRIIHYLLSYKQEFKDKNASKLLDKFVQESVKKLYLDNHKMFRGHTEEIRYDAVDGIGLLSLALIWYQTGEEPENSKYFF